MPDALQEQAFLWIHHLRLRQRHAPEPMVEAIDGLDQGRVPHAGKDGELAVSLGHAALLPRIPGHGAAGHRLLQDVLPVRVGIGRAGQARIVADDGRRGETAWRGGHWRGAVLLHILGHHVRNDGFLLAQVCQQLLGRVQFKQNRTTQRKAEPLIDGRHNLGRADRIHTILREFDCGIDGGRLHAQRLGDCAEHHGVKAACLGSGGWRGHRFRLAA